MTTTPDCQCPECSGKGHVICGSCEGTGQRTEAGPGEVTMKTWVAERMAETGLTESAVWMRYYRAKRRYFPAWRFRRVNARSIYARLKEQDSRKERAA